MMRKELNRQTVPDLHTYPERIVQFGGGNFLRAFVDWIVQELNDTTEFNSGVVLVKATPGTYPELDAQDGLFHVCLRGIQNGQLVNQTKRIDCVTRTVYPYEDFDDYLALARQPDIRFIFSNTTEAGITSVETDQGSDQPPSSFPAKLAIFLHERYQHFSGAPEQGVILLPTELILDNGTTLREIILQHAQKWGYEDGFSRWIEESCVFCNTLVDRIVTGYPQDSADEILDSLGYEDTQLVAGEVYHSWIIEAPQSLLEEFPVDRTGLNIKIVEDASVYRTIKVRLLNGAHTSMVPVGYLLGLESVRESMEHPVLGQFLTDLLQKEVIPTVSADQAELEQFASDVFDRFRNPTIHHRLLAIALNSTSKFKERLLPSLVTYAQQNQAVPPRITLAFASLIRFYKGEWQGQTIPLKDNQSALDFFSDLWANSESTQELVYAVLQNDSLWGQDLSAIDGLADQLITYLDAIDRDGILSVLQTIA